MLTHNSTLLSTLKIIPSSDYMQGIEFVNFRQNSLAAAPNNRLLCIHVLWNLIMNNKSFLDTRECDQEKVRLVNFIKFTKWPVLGIFEGLEFTSLSVM